ncbi:MAG: class II fructose-bisphosphate aldolase [Lachnospiraceae bacterium]|nr:class II fructose-bisphosphate aldolase [Lachnospiraceae bacterium]
MIANPKEILKDAELNNYAIAGINTTTLEGIQAVIEAAEELGTPVMLSHAQSHEQYAPIDVFGPVMVHFAEKAKVPVILHLDHGVELNYVMKAIRNGFTSIMYDCAHLTFEENVAEVKKITKIAHALEIIVEAEVGKMPSNIEGMGGCTQFGVGIENIEQYYTNPEQAEEFCHKTEVDMLAISFGTVHGFFVEKPILDIERVKKIHTLIPEVGLVMHGTTGVDETQIKEAINAGIRKFNYFTGVGTSANESIEVQIKNATAPVYYHEIAANAKTVMKERAKHIINVFQNK